MTFFHLTALGINETALSSTGTKLDSITEHCHTKILTLTLSRFLPWKFWLQFASHQHLRSVDIFLHSSPWFVLTFHTLKQWSPTPPSCGPDTGLWVISVPGHTERIVNFCFIYCPNLTNLILKKLPVSRYYIHPSVAPMTLAPVTWYINAWLNQRASW